MFTTQVHRGRDISKRQQTCGRASETPVHLSPSATCARVGVAVGTECHLIVSQANNFVYRLYENKCRSPGRCVAGAASVWVQLCSCVFMGVIYIILCEISLEFALNLIDALQDLRDADTRKPHLEISVPTCCSNNKNIEFSL